MLQAGHLHTCTRAEIETTIQAHRYLFFEMGLPAISDACYDDLLAHSRQLIADPISPIALHAPGQGNDYADPPPYSEDQKLAAMKILAFFGH